MMLDNMASILRKINKRLVFNQEPLGSIPGFPWAGLKTIAVQVFNQRQVHTGGPAHHRSGIIFRM